MTTNTTTDDRQTYDATNDMAPDRGRPCANCGHCARDHDKERVYPDDGPTGAYHYRYYCPGDAPVDRESSPIADVGEQMVDAVDGEPATDGGEADE